MQVFFYEYKKKNHKEKTQKKNLKTNIFIKYKVLLYIAAIMWSYKPNLDEFNQVLNVY